MAAGGRVAVPARVHERWPPGRGGPVRAGAHVWEPRASRERTRLSLFSNAASGSLNKGDGNRTGRREWRGYRCRATHTHTGVHGSWSRRDRGGPGQPLRVSRPCRYRRPAVRPGGQENRSSTAAAAVQGQLLPVGRSRLAKGFVFVSVLVSEPSAPQRYLHFFFFEQLVSQHR